MRNLTNEFKVGIFVIVAVLLIGVAWVWTLDTIRPGVPSYTLRLQVDDATGLWKGSQIRLAGVQVGAVQDVFVEGDRAVLLLTLQQRYALPVDSVAHLKTSGMLGDMYIAVLPGTADALLANGDKILLGKRPGDLDEITRQVQDITVDVKEITGALRAFTENGDNRDHIEASLANIDALSLELRLLAEQNRHDVGAIVDSVRRLTEGLEGFASETERDVDEEMEKLKEVTDTLQRSMDDIESITGKVDAGEGTIGALVNDRTTVDTLNDTLDNANSVIEGFSGMHAEVFYIGRYYLGTQPDDPQFYYGNPLANSASNTLGIELKSQRDFGYLFSVHDYPQGTITYEERYIPETGSVVQEWIRKPNYRLTFQLQKRWWDLAFRLGVKEGGGGIGVSWFTFQDRLKLSLDAFDWTFGPYPALRSSGIPNVRLGARYEPINHVWLEAGGEQLLLGAVYGYGTGYIGAGFHFTDDDIKLLFATLPLGL